MCFEGLYVNLEFANNPLKNFKLFVVLVLVCAQILQTLEVQLVQIVHFRILLLKFLTVNDAIHIECVYFFCQLLNALSESVIDFVGYKANLLVNIGRPVDIFLQICQFLLKLTDASRRVQSTITVLPCQLLQLIIMRFYCTLDLIRAIRDVMHRLTQFQNIGDFIPESAHLLIMFAHFHANLTDATLHGYHDGSQAVATRPNLHINQVLQMVAILVLWVETAKPV